MDSGPVFAGQRVGFQFDYSLPAAVANGTAASFRLYAGADTSGALLASYDGTFAGNVTAGTYRFTLMADPVPQVSQVTLSAKLGDNAAVTKTYQVSVSPSGSATLNFLSSPQTSEFNSRYPSASRTVTGGPSVFDAAAFTDATTGKLSLFLAVSGGVMTMSDTGSAELAYMPGMAFDYGGNEHNCGGAFAVGGSDKDHLAALVRDNTGQNNVDCVYTYTSGGTWQKAASSNLASNVYDTGLVMSQSDIWVSDQHWNGSAWTTTGFPSGVTFNSFWKQDANTAYAGSGNGIYKYSGGNWTQVSGTSGTMYIASAAQSTGGAATLVTAGSYWTGGRTTWEGGMSGSVNEIAVAGDGSATVTPIDTSGKYVGIGNDGALWAITAGRSYYINQFADYYGAYIYKYVNGAWQYQNVTAFNDATDNANIAAGITIGNHSGTADKSQPDSVQYILNPCAGVTLFVGYAGAIYTQYGTTTITFNTDGGSAVTAKTGTIGSAVTAPTSPTKSAYNFGGWYADDELTVSYSFATYNIMPAKDITLYAKWIPRNSQGGPADSLATEKTQSIASLNTAYAKFHESDYSPGNWNTLTAAYNTGLAGIQNATTYDGVYDALNSAIAAMGAIPADRSSIVTIAVSMDANTIGLGYIVKPTLVTVPKGTKASKVITDLLTANGLHYESTGSVNSDFYLAQVYPVNQTNAVAADFILAKIGAINAADRSDNKLGEFDYYYMSGWMYSIGGGSSYLSFPGVGAASWYMGNGEVMRWQFTVYGYGSDLNADNSAWGSTSLVPNLGDKSVLTWEVARLRTQYKDSVLEANKDYAAAMTALTDPDATQGELNSALSALQKANFNTSSSASGGTSLAPAATASNGTVSVAISAADMASLIADAKTKGSSSIVIAPEITGEASKVSVDLPKGSLASIASETDAALVVETPVGNISIPNGALSSIASQATGGTVTVSLATVDSTTLTAAQREAVGDDPVYDINVLSGGTHISGFGGNSITISLPYTLKEGEDPSHVTVWYLNDAGVLERVACTYDPATGLASFPTDHLSYYVVGYSEAAPPPVPAQTQTFSDVSASDWFYDSVTAAVYRGLMNGTSATTFSPNDPMTRAMLVTVLYRLEGSPAVMGANSFSDVKDNEWYTEAVTWASANNIVTGYGGRLFGTNDSVTREQLAAILYRYSNYKSYDVTKTTDLSSYTDAPEIDGWAQDALKWANAGGLITGRTATTLAPEDTATRAEVATILIRFVEGFVE